MKSRRLQKHAASFLCKTTLGPESRTRQGNRIAQAGAETLRVLKKCGTTIRRRPSRKIGTPSKVIHHRKEMINIFVCKTPRVEAKLKEPNPHKGETFLAKPLNSRSCQLQPGDPRPRRNPYSQNPSKEAEHPEGTASYVVKLWTLRWEADVIAWKEKVLITKPRTPKSRGFGSKANLFTFCQK